MKCVSRKSTAVTLIKMCLFTFPYAHCMTNIIVHFSGQFFGHSKYFHVFVCIYIYIYIYVCVCVCVCVCIYIIYIYKRFLYDK